MQLYEQQHSPLQWSQRAAPERQLQLWAPFAQHGVTASQRVRCHCWAWTPLLLLLAALMLLPRLVPAQMLRLAHSHVPESR